ncbi:MAG: Obg family GTPase CgtA [Adlercreutzia equolifaciens]
MREDSIAAAEGNEFVRSPIDPKLYRVSALDGRRRGLAEGRHRHQGARPARQAARRAGGIRHAVRPRDGSCAARPARSGFDIISEGPGAWRVSGVQVERMVVQTDWENEEAVAFFQHRFKRMGSIRPLEKAGARGGDECASSASSLLSRSPRRCRGRLPGVGSLMDDATHRRASAWW